MSRSSRDQEALSASAQKRVPPAGYLPVALAALLAVCAVALSLGPSPSSLIVAGQILSASIGGPTLP